MILNKIIKQIALAKYFNHWIIFVTDLFFSTLATAIALAGADYLIGTSYSLYNIIGFIGISMFASIISFFCSQIHKGVIRHSAFTETVRIIVTILIKLLVMTIVLTFLPMINTWKIVVFILIIDASLTFFMLITIRAILIIVYNRIILSYSSSNKKNILIFGNDLSDFANLSSQLMENDYNMLGYLATNQSCTYRINGKKVFTVKNQEEFDDLTTRLNIQAIIFSTYQAVKEEDERLIRYCEKKQIKMFVLPSVDELKEGKITMRNLPEVHIEDLLGRKEIEINLQEIKATLKDKVVLVTGAAGSIGSELCRQLSSFNLKQLILFDSAETPMHNIRLELEEKYPEISFLPIMGDVRMPSRVESAFKRFSPQIVFHAAAYKHVPLMEENPCEAVLTNVFGTRTVADLAVKYNVSKFIMISTDKAVNPTNIMGASKRLAEIYVQSLSMAIERKEHPGNTRFITTRFGNVLGSNGSVIPRFREQLAKGGPLTVTHPDIVRYFMTIPEACRLVLEAAFMGKGNEIFVFDMGSPVKIADLAKRMIELAGLKPDEDIKIYYTGLRTGEKLYEELLATKENTIPTGNKKIFRATVREYNFQDVSKAIEQLNVLAAQVDKIQTVQLMKQLVPEFKSQHSEFELLDKINSPKII